MVQSTNTPYEHPAWRTPNLTAVLSGSQPRAFPVTDQQRPVSLMPAVQIEQLCKHYGTKVAVDRLSLTIQQGEIFGLLGPNGSGKTTTINMISGLSRPTSGTVRLLGYDVQQQAAQVRRLLGSVPQETALFEMLSAEFNLWYHAVLYGVPRRVRAERIRAMLELLGLDQRRHERVSTFSGGMKRRLALARQLLHEPRILYLDEPTLGVDVQNKLALYAHIRSLPKRGMTVLLTTNDMAEAQAICTRLAIIVNGKLQVVDTPKHLAQTYSKGSVIVVRLQEHEDVRGDGTLAQAIRAVSWVKQVQQQGTTFTITVTGGQEKLSEIATLLHQRGRHIEHIEIAEANLEDAYVSITGQLAQ